MIGNAAYWLYFREAMRDLGYREGQNVKYELRTDETEPARLAEAAKELANRKLLIRTGVVDPIEHRHDALYARSTPVTRGPLLVSPKKRQHLCFVPTLGA
jgi:hypothetical protein